MADVTTETVATLWWCEGCGSRGRVEMDAHAGVYEGFATIMDLHERTAGDCQSGHALVRVALDEPVASTSGPEDRDAFDGCTTLGPDCACNTRYAEAIASTSGQGDQGGR
jgi:hypothetical protein